MAKQLPANPTDEERNLLANLIPLGFSERDPAHNVFEAADRILAAGFRYVGPCRES